MKSKVYVRSKKKWRSEQEALLDVLEKENLTAEQLIIEHDDNQFRWRLNQETDSTLSGIVGFIIIIAAVVVGVVFCAPYFNNSSANEIDHESTKSNTEAISDMPDIEGIKAELLGRTIGNWTFNKAEEFDNVEISNSTLLDDYNLNLDVKLKLTDYKTGESCSGDIIMNYYRSNINQGYWAFQNVSGSINGQNDNDHAKSESESESKSESSAVEYNNSNDNNRKIICPNCNGSRKDYFKCRQCGGDGSDCSRCRGRGEEELSCQVCKGTGRVNEYE